MNKRELIEALQDLNNKMILHNIYGEIAMYGGAVMCLVLNARSNTKDIDAIFEPKMDILKLSEITARDLGLPLGWLNDGVKGFLSKNNNVVETFRLSNLKIYAATPEYMFAMKSASARLGNANEIKDIKFLIRLLNITDVGSALSIIDKYYPLDTLPQKTYYMLCEIFGSSR
jgi:hypothetical protein